MTRMTSDIDGVQTVIANTFTSILSNVITLVIAAIAMFQKNWILALVGIIIVPLFTLPTRKAGKTLWSLTNESQAAIDPIIESKTSILIAHRLSTILAADEILVVKDGMIVERGQHKDLVSAGGVYQELYETQFSKALAPQEEEGISELQQYLWGAHPADEPY